MDTTSIKSIVGWLPWLPWMFIRHYVYPFFVTGRRIHVDPGRFFDEHYKFATSGDKITDEMTIGANYDANHARLHYNAVERSIILALSKSGFRQVADVLDIGSGSGHWIDFYRRCYAAKRCTGIDISEVSVNYLKVKYAYSPDVTMLRGDVSDPGFYLDKQFDTINAIGVLFHIVSDEELVQALSNFKKCLSERGCIVVGGQFGKLTRDVFFNVHGNHAEVIKRIRSYRWWMRTAKQLDLQVVIRQKTQNARGILFPENNVLVLAHRKS